MKCRGSSMLLFIGFISVLTVLLFVMAQMSIFHLQFAQETNVRQMVRDLAESAVNEALAQVAQNTGATPTMLVPGAIPDESRPTHIERTELSRDSARLRGTSATYRSGAEPLLGLPRSWGISQNGGKLHSSRRANRQTS